MLLIWVWICKQQYWHVAHQGETLRFLPLCHNMLLEYSVLPLLLRLPSKDLNNLCHKKHSNQWSVNLRPPFCIFSKKAAELAVQLHAYFPLSAPCRGEELLLFIRKFTTVYWNFVKYGSMDNFSIKSCFDISSKLGIPQNAKSCSKYEKLLKSCRATWANLY